MRLDGRPYTRAYAGAFAAAVGCAVVLAIVFPNFTAVSDAYAHSEPRARESIYSVTDPIANACANFAADFIAHAISIAKSKPRAYVEPQPIPFLAAHPSTHTGDFIVFP